MAVRRQSRGGTVPFPLVVVTLGAVLLSVAGCSAESAVVTAQPPAGSAGPGRAAVLAAAGELARAGTARVRTAMEMVTGHTRVTIEGRGAFDLAAGTGRLRVTLPPGADGTPPGERRLVRELVTPGALYMRNRAGVPADKWVRVDTTGLRDGNLVTGGATDPVTAAQLLRGARQVAYEGVTELDGSRVWHYSGVVDIERAASGAPPVARRRLEAAEKGFSGHTVPFDAYLDGQGRLRKVQHRFTFAADPDSPPDADYTVSSTTRLYAFGTRVRISMPEAGDIWTGEIAAP
ncbi:hypothetical protein ACIGW3_27845 [Streptomyces sp. NPDC053499]|uniref:hypothetical protein n=1 Tax=Streptomyces sp. NPDC053499 TaxID=3365707 RepID=UPI001FA9B222|nr:hypothetical protein [Streptomyces sp. 891-h]UNZ18566.1 hypothetical protein HC362_17565 [Streptomyces sp. 891-h]